MDKETKEKLVQALKEEMREFRAKYWLTLDETTEIMKEVLDRALIGAT